MKKPSLLSRENLLPEALFLLAALVASFFVGQLRLRLCDPFAGPAMFTEIANHVGTKPWQYRILVPVIASALSHLRLPVHVSLYGWARLIELVSMVLFVTAFRRYLDLFLKDRRASSILSFLVFLVLPFEIFFPRPYHANYWFDTPAMLFFTLGLILLYQEKWLPYYVLFIVATLNRETTCFLTLIYLFSALGRERLVRIGAHCAAQFVIWMAIKVALGRIYAGNPGPNGFEWYDPSGVTHYADNLRFLMKPKNYPGMLSFMGFAWIPVICCYKHIGSGFLRRALWVVPPFFLGMFLVANIYELRIFGELMPVILAPCVVIVAGFLRNPPAETEIPS